MSALNELGIQCQRRGWRLALDGHYPNGRHNAGLRLDRLEVRARNGTDILVTVAFDPADPETAAIAAARELDARGLIA